jgi:hypothetical protein
LDNFHASPGESLINGAPQRIDDGAIILGLSAWHLYPDILLAGSSQVIKQSDPLVSTGGIITVGLEGKAEASEWVVWSLPLTQVKYYGEPVVATRHAGVGESVVTFDEFMLVAVGSVLGSWRLPSQEIEDALGLIKAIALASQSADKSVMLRRKCDEIDSPVLLKDMHLLTEDRDWQECLPLFAKSVDYFDQAAWHR